MKSERAEFFGRKSRIWSERNIEEYFARGEPQILAWSVFEKCFLQDVRHNLWEIAGMIF